MTNQKSLDIWQHRWHSLNDAISCAQSEITGQAARLNSPKQRRRNTIETLKGLLTCLQSFAESHFTYFHNLFFASEAGSEQRYADYPPEYVLSVVLDQISFDLTAIKQATSQRLSNNAQDYKTLEKADKLARLALQPVMAHFHLDDARVVTYFKKDTSIRVVPYAPVTLIGIPYTVINVAQDFLAIPHEIGHYVYWHGALANGRTVQQELTDIVPKEPDWCYDWLEETFADVYGCLIAGPTVALSFQDLQMRRRPKEFIENDEDHPVPILRPRIYTKILEQYFDGWGKQLDERWNDKWVERAEANEFENRDGRIIPVHEAISAQPGLAEEPVDKMIAKILTVLSDQSDDNIIEGNVNWWQDHLAQATATDELYATFSKHVNQLADKDLPAPPDEIPCASFQSLLPQWLELGQQAREKAEAPKPPEWLPVLSAGGWTTRGPVCEGAGTCD